ncbi:cytochrome c oxidase assembly protein [Bhargavaea ullalensis]|uniref:Membrane protein n=1 Tax=Bhargavaea ullalensis TaxID=1265685 RepID=A0ABV2GEC7_9BACL
MPHEFTDGWTTAISAIALLIGLTGVFLYFWGMAASGRKGRYRRWPGRRPLCWSSGIFFAWLPLSPFFLEAAHHDFRFHMTGHLLLGMAAPMLMAAGAPVKLLLRSLPVNKARKVAGVIRKPVFSFYRHPVTASVLNIGGLWILYTTPLFGLMHHHPLLFLLVHAHLFLAGYLFTVSVLYFDPAPNGHSPLFRTIVFIPSLAAHGILSKLLYAYPPSGVSLEQARQGAMIMYYGGDLIDLAIIVVLFHGWYKKPGYRRTKSRFGAKKPVSL